MAHVRISPAAQADFDSIVDELAIVKGATVATRHAAAFRRFMNQLVDNPGLGAPRRKLGARIRMLIVSPYLIFYEGTPKAKSVTVLRIRHGSRRITRRTIAAGRDDPDD